MKSVIYETKGRAREFSELAINLFTGCGHGCEYCFGPNILHIDRDKFHSEIKPRITPEDIERSARGYGHRDEKRSILLCFVTDPYQPVENETKLTRKTIEMLHKYGLKVTILTKAGERAMRDFDILLPGDTFATTLTLLTIEDTVKWEPLAGQSYERIKNLKEAHNIGLETWVSLEPVIKPQDSIVLMFEAKDFVDHYKVGILNYHPHADTIDWYSFGWKIKSIMDNFGIKYYLKHDLQRKMGLIK